MIAWMVYAAAVGGIVAVGALAMERLAAAMGRPRRIAWLAALTLAVAIPLTGGWSRPAAAPVETDGATPGVAVTAGAPNRDVWSAIPTPSVPRGVANGKVALLVWGAGSLASLAVLGGVLVLVARGRRRWERRSVRGSEVYVSRGFGPALVGVTRPEVVVPSWVMELDPDARDAIIRHEAEHARARDHLALLYGGLVAAAFPWSPAIWWMYRRLRAAVELDCDQRVLASGIGVADYGDVLLSAGSRSRGRWGFAPAMGQPESLLERRLKTMSEKRRKLSGGYGALLMAVAAGAVVVACDAPVPTEVREAFEEAMADDGAQGADGEREDWVERFLSAGALGAYPAPLLYVDGIRIQSEKDLFAMDLFLADAGTGEVRRLAERVGRVEVLKGPAAAELYGEEGAGGVIQIFTKDAEADSGATLDVVVVPPGEDVIVRGVAGLTIETGPDDHYVVTPSVREIVVAEPEVAFKAPRTRTIVVRGVVRQEPARMLAIRRAKVTEPGSDRDDWFAENALANAPPSEMPVIYVDGVRLDGSFAGLNEPVPALAPDEIDRIEVIEGDAARDEFGQEAANGVIRIFTKKASSDKPAARRPK